MKCGVAGGFGVLLLIAELFFCSFCLSRCMNWLWLVEFTCGLSVVSCTDT